jgi:hypothetical protein
MGDAKIAAGDAPKFLEYPDLHRKIALYAIATYNVPISVAPAAIIFMCHSKSE